MNVKLLFVHGTGAHDVGATLDRLSHGVHRVLGWPRESVVAVPWGKDVGPDDLDVRPALPPEETRAALEVAGADFEATALWALLITDPTAELRMLEAVAPRAASDGVDPLRLPASQAVRAALGRLTVPPEALAAAGVSDADLAAAVTDLLETGAPTRAADAVDDPLDPDLVVATARAVVALVVRDHWADERPPAVVGDAAARDALVHAVEEAIAPARGIPKLIGEHVLLPMATRFVKGRRADFMGPATDFARDIAFYLRRGDTVTDYLAKYVKDHADASPLVLLGHSLGGVACVDLLSDPAYRDGPVDLLVTVGSQSPLLYLMDAMCRLRPGTDAKPFTPWLNVYNRSDFLSFRAGAVFDGVAGITDVAYPEGVPFPMSHSAYWERDDLYDHIGQALG